MIPWIVLGSATIFTLIYLYSIAEFQFAGRYRTLESLSEQEKNMAQLLEDRRIPFFTRQNLWRNLRGMERDRLVGIRLVPADTQEKQQITLYHLCHHGTRLLNEERAKRLPPEAA